MLATEENEVLHPAQSQEAKDLIEQAQCLVRLRDAPERMLEGLRVVDVMLAGKARCQCFVLPGRELFDRLNKTGAHSPS